MSQVATSFADSTYSASNKPSTTTLKADIQALETAHNATDAAAATLTGSETLTNKVLTSPVINTQITGSAIVDEDNMASDSAVKVPTQQSVKAYIASIMSTLNPIGTIREFNVSTNPATLLGFGTWSAYGAGRVTVAIDAGQTEFDTVDETGGEKTHLLTGAESGTSVHGHTSTAEKWAGIRSVDAGTTTVSPDSGKSCGMTSAIIANSSAADASSAHNNLQPYITVYRWLRTA